MFPNFKITVFKISVLVVIVSIVFVESNNESLLSIPRTTACRNGVITCFSVVSKYCTGCPIKKGRRLYHENRLTYDLRPSGKKYCDESGQEKLLEVIFKFLK